MMADVIASIGATNQKNGHLFFAAPHLWQMEIFKLLARKKTRWTLGGFTKTPLKQLFFFGMSFKTHGGKQKIYVSIYIYIHIATLKCLGVCLKTN